MPILTNPWKRCYSDFCDDPEISEKALEGEQESLPRVAGMDDQSGQDLDHACTWRKTFLIEKSCILSDDIT